MEENKKQERFELVGYDGVNKRPKGWGCLMAGIPGIVVVVLILIAVVVVIAMFAGFILEFGSLFMGVFMLLWMILTGGKIGG